MASLASDPGAPKGREAHGLCRGPGVAGMAGALRNAGEWACAGALRPLQAVLLGDGGAAALPLHTCGTVAHTGRHNAAR